MPFGRINTRRVGSIRDNRIFKLLFYIKPYLPIIIISVIVTFILSLINIFVANYMKIMTDTVLKGNWSDFIRTVYFLIFIMITGFILKYINRYLIGRFTSGSMCSMRRLFINRIFNMPVSYLESRNTGDIISVFTNDMNKVQSFLQSHLQDLLYQPLAFISAFVYLFTINRPITIISTVVLPLVMFLTNKITGSLEQYAFKLQERLGQSNSILEDVIMGMPIVKSFNLQDLMYDKYRKIIRGVINEGINIEKRRLLIRIFTTVLGLTPYLLFAVYGGYLSLHGYMTAGDMIAFLSLLEYLYAPLTVIPYIASDIKVDMASFTRLFEILDQPVESRDGRRFLLEPNQPVISFNDVYFSYDGQNDVLKGLSFDLPEGHKVGLVGESGSGKSTIFKLICGFYRHQKGQVKIYGHDISEWDIKALRSQISLVSQDTYLFPCTIEENIRYGRPDATREEVIQAAKLANAHDFIVKLPQGYDTVVGERSTNLSGGERQRIAIARAILKDAPILLLDEATSALDSQSETLVQQALERLMKNRTVLMIAHRLSTIRNADEIFVLRDGKIVERGNHDELMERGGLYRQLYLEQFANMPQVT
ncbi:ATP-binding cassette, subfamily B, MsbA [Caldanaerobius fijiensis DSM 17918]|uniref:ATP-binding cassette, subfamily B, MsbA n=1 Tax=Caldanaerobius fijiensis DSM 17918 TaxID=1121256 RepID=A0A1M5EXX9_9THEO|nr:ABC transporter ATP-binding protein [Caldanaerobius fijiensis]SHF84058.1 ATP-binding cassette, subfamily B, MsbA [Caldanaerobius fijiensis DSM 17918]